MYKSNGHKFSEATILAHGSESYELPNPPADVIHVPRLLLALEAHSMALIRGGGAIGGEADAIEAPLRQGNRDETDPGD